jgi:hypothetical protein
MNPTALALCFLTLVAPSWRGSETNDGTGSFVAHGFTSQSVISSLPTLSKTLGPGFSRHRRPYGYYATTDEEQKSLDNELETADVEDAEESHQITPEVNGAIDSASSIATNSTNSTETIDFAAIAVDMNTSMVELLDEISQRINEGSSEIMKDITNVLDEQLTQVPDAKTQELTAYLTELTNKLQKAQEDEIQRQITELEKLFVSPLERVAFSDAPLFDLKEKKQSAVNETEAAEVEIQLVLAGANSTLRKSARQGTTMELMKNLNVAPLYYSVALFYRWIGKSKSTITLPSLYLLSAYKSMANVIKTRGGPRRRTKKENKLSTIELYTKDAEAFQSGWKRTGEIAAKGPWAKKLAELRRSAEIWAYFSSFYLKDRRITKNFESGKWTEEKFTHERSRLGAEVTQNLLRLGPTFIKVRRLNSKFTFVIGYSKA